jgi:aspartate 1-decarboxylase
MRILLAAKLHGGRVTGCDLDYEGSCGIGPDLLKASGIRPLEKVSVLNVSTGGRLETYAIRAPRNGELTLNGAAARHAARGDKLIVLTFAVVADRELAKHRARIVILGPGNKIVRRRTERA